MDIGRKSLATNSAISVVILFARAGGQAVANVPKVVAFSWNCLRMSDGMFGFEVVEQIARSSCMC